MFRKLFTAAALSLCSLPAAAFDFGGIPPESLSLYVQDLNSGRMLAEHRADEPVNPASTMKLVTAFAAFRALGANYRWKTGFKSTAGIGNGVLQGDIYWQGSGDPVFDQKDLLAVQQQLRGKGIRNIAGQLVLDRSLWTDTGSADDFANDAREAFTTAPDPVMLAYKVAWLKAEDDGAGGVNITSNPPLPEIPLVNRAAWDEKNADAECKKPSAYLNAGYNGGALHVSGKLPRSCAGKEIFVNMLTMPEFAAKSFVNHWRGAGGQISDGHREGVTPSEAATLAVAESKPLHEILADMNKHSNNVIARTVFLQLGGKRQDGQTVRRAESVLRRELGEAGIRTDALVLENGSGLSRRERVSTRMLGEMLEKTYYSRFRQHFIDSLPAAGGDGTLKTRLKQAGSSLRLKTGTLKNVAALAGYWTGGRPLVVVAVINHENAAKYQPALDRLVTRIVSQIEWEQAYIRRDIPAAAPPRRFALWQFLKPLRYQACYPNCSG
ncbi:D-alanyl-D-alanine carboxypeptidase/D-alanyl-D-alanine-endopeptidase [Neisseria sp.]|uniref:D-alanyl-D-alanine carboxypeptidase/D-alanyl-D-alanine endopeptidase n=1 Tax=Neisseria sp. TaxID=192066 RepID=UPI0035A19EBD